MSDRKIDDRDYNELRTRIENILGNGRANSGYGQGLKSFRAEEGALISSEQWNSLSEDLSNTVIHQTGSFPEIPVFSTNRLITLADFDLLMSLTSVLDTNKFSVGTGRSQVKVIESKSTTQPWTVRAQTNLTVTFSTGDEARYFFNSGGKIRLTSSRSGGNTSQQNSAWSNLLESVGVLDFVANPNTGIGFYNLTNEYQTWFQRNVSTPYSLNYFRVEVSSDVSSNSFGSARKLFFKITWEDLFSAPQDRVDGELKINVIQIKSLGPLKAEREFTIQDPLYELENINLSGTPEKSYSLIVDKFIANAAQDVFRVTLNTLNVPDGEVVPYTISGVLASEINSEPLRDSFIVRNNTAFKIFRTTSSDYVAIPQFVPNPVPIPIAVPIPVAAPPSCIDPPDTSDQYAIYGQGMVLRYTSGRIQQNNTLVKSTRTPNASIVNGWYQSVIGRPAETPGWIGWIQRLNNGESQSSVYAALVRAAQQGELANFGRVTNVYTFCEFQRIGPPPPPAPPPPPPPPPPKQSRSLEFTSSGGAGSDTISYWTVPNNVFSVTVTAVGGGAGGSSGSEANPYVSGGGGGGAGGYVKQNISVSPGQRLAYKIGKGGAGAARTSGGNVRIGAAGSDTYFHRIVARGGEPATFGLSRSHYNVGGKSGTGGIDATDGEIVRSSTDGNSVVVAGGRGGSVPGFGSGGAGGPAPSVINFAVNTRQFIGSRAITYPDWNSTMNQYAIWDNNLAAPRYTISQTTFFPFTGTYTFYLQSDNSGSLSIDGVVVLTTNSNFNSAPAQVNRVVSAGNHTISVSGQNIGGYRSDNPAGIAGLIIGSGRAAPANDGNGYNGTGYGAGGGGGFGQSGGSPPQGGGGTGADGYIRIEWEE